MGHACCRPFRLPVPDYPTMLRFYLPLIEPDGRISRSRLSDKESSLRPREGSSARPQSCQMQDLVQVCVRETCHSLTPHLVLGAQPLTQPTTHVSIDRSIGLAHRPQAEVVRPPDQHPVQVGDYLPFWQQGRVSPGAVRDRVANAADLLRRRFRAQVGTTRLLRVAPAAKGE